MIKGNINSKKFSLEKILETTDEYFLYQYYWRSFKLHKLYKSPLRQDNNPSFSIYADKNGRLKHVDFAFKAHSGDIVTLVMYLYGLNYYEALKRIESDLKGVPNTRSKFVHVPKPKTLIQFVPRKFNSDDLKYWNKYTIQEDELKKENVFSIERAYVNKILWEPDCDLRYAYVYEEDGEEYIKLYCPERKIFRNNFPQDVLAGWDNMKSGGKVGIVVKSFKEKLLYNRFLRETCVITSENINCIPEDKVTILTNSFERVYLNTDNDKVGKEVMTHYEKKGILPLISPTNKDISEMVEVHGIEVFEEFIKKII